MDKIGWMSNCIDGLVRHLVPSTLAWFIVVAYGVWVYIFIFVDT